MDRRYIGITIIAIGLAILIAVIYFAFFHNYGSEPIPAPDAGTQPVVRSTSSQSTLPQDNGTSIQEPVKPVFIDKKEQDAKRSASSFAERFGSYSSQSGLSNLEGLKVFATNNMKNWLTQFISQEKGHLDTRQYYAITTKAVTSEIRNYLDDDRVVVLVHTQRQEISPSAPNPKSFQQDILITLTKEGSAWKVDKAYWQ